MKTEYKLSCNVNLDITAAEFEKLQQLLKEGKWGYVLEDLRNVKDDCSIQLTSISPHGCIQTIENASYTLKTLDGEIVNIPSQDQPQSQSE